MFGKVKFILLKWETGNDFFCSAQSVIFQVRARKNQTKRKPHSGRLAFGWYCRVDLQWNGFSLNGVVFLFFCVCVCIIC